MFSKFTEKARRVIFFARYEAAQLGSNTIETEHFLLGLLREDRRMLSAFLDSPELVATIGPEIQERFGSPTKVSLATDMPLSAHCKQALTYAVAEAERLKHDSVSTEHILLGLLRSEDGEAAKIFRSRGLDLAAARERLANVQLDVTTHENVRSIVSVVPVLRVAEFDRSVRWYREVLGFEVHLGGPPGAATLRRDSVEIMLQEIGLNDDGSVQQSRAGARWDLYIRVRDVQAWRADIQEKLGISLPLTVTEPRYSEFQFNDPDGHVIVFGEYAG